VWVMDQLKRGRAVNREDDERREEMGWLVTGGVLIVVGVGVEG